jgi:hypothetical protein
MCKYLDSHLVLSFLLLGFVAICGCGTQSMQPNSTPAVQQDQPHDYGVYVAQNFPRFFAPSLPAIAAYHVTPDGAAQAVNGSPFPAPQGITQLLAGDQGGFLFANNIDSYDPTTGSMGPNRGIYSFRIGADGSLDTAARLTQTYFPVSLSSSGDTLYASESTSELFGLPLHLSVYSVNPANGQLAPEPAAGFSVNGQESFDGAMTHTQGGFWIKVEFIEGSSEMSFLHFETAPGSDTPLSATQLMLPDITDLYSRAIAGSEHFLLIRDGDARVQPVLRTYSVQNGAVTRVQDCVPGPACNFTLAVIHPSEHFAFLQSSDSVSIVPLDPTTGFGYDQARSVPLSSVQTPITSAMAVSADGKLLAIAREQQLDIFTVAPDGSLTPAAGSPFSLPFSDAGEMAITMLPH